MPELRSLTRQKIVAATLDLGEGESLTMRFDANKVTPRWMDDTMQRVEAQDMLSIAEALAAVIVEWDVFDDGVPFLPTRGNIAVFPFPVINRLFEEVCRSAAPLSEEGNDSRNTSSTPTGDSSGMQDGHPNGPSPSTLPEPSASQPVT